MKDKTNYRQPTRLTSLMTLVQNEYAIQNMIDECHRLVEKTAAMRDGLGGNGKADPGELNMAVRQTELLEHLEETLQAVHTEAGMATKAAACGFGGEFTG